MAKMNIPLPKEKIMSILQINSMPRDWKRNGSTISTYHGCYIFKSGFAMSMFADTLSFLLNKNPNADRDSLFVGLFKSLSISLPDLFSN